MSNTMTASATRWDTSYEWKTVALLGVGFGLVGLDRWIIASLFPAMAADLGLPEGEIGRLAGILGILWGVFAIFSGRLSDSIGHRKVLIPAIILFSLMSGFSGMVQSLIALVWIRAIMGAMEGTYCPTSFTAVAAASRPERRGFNQGLQQSGFALMGFALGPIIAIQLLDVVPSWRWVFWICAIPGFIVGVLLYFQLREPKDTQAGALIGATQAGGSWIEVLKTPNIVVCMLALLCAMACLRARRRCRSTRPTPSSWLRATLVSSFRRWASAAFSVVAGRLSDRFGRAACNLLHRLTPPFIGLQTGRLTLSLFVALFVTVFLLATRVDHGPIATSRSWRADLGSHRCRRWCGEIFGGGVAPIIAGGVTDRYGLPSALNVALTGVALGIVVCFFLRETAPRKTAAVAPQAA
jgi:MFS family permease